MSENLPTKPPTMAPGIPEDEKDLVARLEAIKQRRHIWETLLAQQKNHPLYDKARRWLRSVDIDDPKAEFEGQLAALKVWGHLDKDFRDMILATKTVNKDRAASLQEEKQRAAKAREYFKTVLKLVKHPEALSDEERAKEIKKLEQWIERLT